MKCYILGAGASEWYSDSLPSDRRPPSSQHIFKRAHELEILNEDDFPELCEAIAEDRGISTSLESADSDELEMDIEAFLGRLEQRHRLKGEHLSGALGQCNFVLYELFRTFQKYYDLGLNNYTRLVRYQHENPYNIISLNYDTLVEMALITSGLEFDYQQYGSTPPETVNIAKIHGSVNFLVDLSQNIPADPLKMSEVAKFHFSNKFGEKSVKNRILSLNDVAHTRHEDLLVSREEYYTPALIPPIGDNKPYEQFGIFSYMRQSAKEMISDAEEIVIIGSSVREEDTVLHDIFSNVGMREVDVKVVCGSQSEEVADRVGESIPNANFDTKHERFAEYIESL